MKSTRIIQILVFSIAILISEPLFAQGIYGKVTPQTSDFVKYGETPVSLYTGRMNLEVPIYEIKDRDFDIPISLVYTSDGFKLNKRSGFAGMDWIINGGGVITREVYGSPDDGYPDQLAGSEVGYWVVTQDPNRRYSKTDLCNFNTSIVTCYQDFCSLPFYESRFVDYRQDLFMFNFYGHNGKFVIDNDHNIKVNKNGYKVDFSRFKTQPMTNRIPDTSAIVITTPDGYIYTFGGDLSALEYTITFAPGFLLESGKTRPTILAWHLSKITAPNGRTVNFNYVVEDLTNYGASINYPIYQSTRETYSNSNIYKAVKNVVLESITVDTTRIEFVKSIGSSADSLFYSGYSDFNNRNYQLDSIRIKYNNQTKFRYGLSYESRSKRRFLTSISQPDGSYYNFIYNHPLSYPYYPSPDNAYVDSYGYWGSNDTTHSCGLLNRVNYPTGGYSTFTYEANKYGKSLDTYIYSLDQYDLRTSLINTNGTTGGARIKQIENYSSSSKLETKKKYYYIKGNFPLNYDSCSGILYQSTPYYYTSYGSKVYLANNAWNSNYNIEQPHIGYSSIFEVINDSTKIKYEFSDYISNSDSQSKYYVSNDTIVVLKDLLIASINWLTSYASKRGLLLSKKYFTDNNVNVKNEFYGYKYVNTHKFKEIEREYVEPYFSDDVVVSFFPVTNGAACTQIVLEDYPLTYKKEWLNGVLTEEYYNYNDLDLISSKKWAMGSSDTIRTEYKYPSDFTSEEDVYMNLANRNLLNLNVEQKEFRNNDLAKTIRNKYSISLINNAPIIDTVKIGLGANSPEARTIYVSYDSYGNPTEVVDKNGDRMVYIWGYSGKYIIAEIKNSTLSEIEEYSSEYGLNLNYLTTNAEPSSSDLILLSYALSSLSNALVTTYKYKPLVGMTSMTDPRGLTTTYEYDTQNRLVCIKDPNGKILKKYEYHYAQ